MALVRRPVWFYQTRKGSRRPDRFFLVIGIDARVVEVCRVDETEKPCEEAANGLCARLFEVRLPCTGDPVRFHNDESTDKLPGQVLDLVRIVNVCA